MSGPQPCLPVPRKRPREDSNDDEPKNTNSFDNLLDANDYLRRVMEQARQIPEIMVCPDDNNQKTDDNAQVNNPRNSNNHHEIIDGSMACVQYLVSPRTALQPPPSQAHAASREWTNQVLQVFQQLRDYLDTCRSEYHLGTARRIPIPPLKEQASWHLFCVGRDDAQGNAGAYFQDSEGEDDASAKETSAVAGTDKQDDIPLWKQNLPETGFRTPTVELLCQLDQVAVRRVLSHLVHFCVQGWSAATPLRSAWLYALLARLDRHPLHREEAALLRRFLQNLSVYRAKLQNRTEIARVNLLLVIVGVYFEQCGGYEELMRLKEDEMAVDE